MIKLYVTSQNESIARRLKSVCTIRTPIRFTYSDKHHQKRMHSQIHFLPIMVDLLLPSFIYLCQKITNIFNIIPINRIFCHSYAGRPYRCYTNKVCGNRQGNSRRQQSTDVDCSDAIQKCDYKDRTYHRK